jgi:hypothetical protein
LVASARHDAVVDAAEQGDQVRSLVKEVIEAQDFDGKAELLAQIPAIEVVGGPLTFFELAVDYSTVVQSAFQGGPVPGTDLGCKRDWDDDRDAPGVGG